MVQFADLTEALVGIASTASVAEIDHYVSEYDPDFLPDPASMMNPHISVGETRTSTPIAVTLPSFPDPNDFTPEEIMMADLVSRNGDNSLRDIFDAHVTAFYPNSDLTTAGFFTSIFQDKSNEILAGLGTT